MSGLSLAALRKYLLDNLGLNFDEKQEESLYEKIEKAAQSFHFSTTDSFINWLVNQTLSPSQVQKLASLLTIGETYFFRERKALDYLEYHFIPKLIQNRKKENKSLRIWSAGCSSGEEPYTVAILLKRTIPDIENWDITLLATDINAQFIEKAKKGIYSEWSFRGLSDTFKTKYFKKKDSRSYQISGKIQDMVTFSYLNLASDQYPSHANSIADFDIILCRNVLIYFSQEGIKTVTSKLYHSLVDGGVLLVSPVESSNLIYSKFERINFEGITVYRNSRNGEKIREDQSYNNYKIGIDFSLEKKLSYTSIYPTLPTRKTRNYRKKDNLKKRLPESATEKASIRKITSGELNNEGALYKKALDFYQAGLYEKATEQIDNAIDTNPENMELFLLLLARIRADRGMLDESESLCKQALYLNKTEPTTHYLMANILHEQGKEREAILSLNNVIYLDPDFTLAHFMLGNIFLNSGRNKESSKCFDNALKCLAKLSPDEIPAESNGLTAEKLTELIKGVSV